MARALMIQGAASYVGKSLLCTALCRIFRQDGYRVAPFKGWNMALNSYVTSDGGEIGRAQGEQAAAAGLEATVEMNPILVKPKGPGQSQVIVRGRVYGDVDYHTRTETDYLEFCLGVIREAYGTLADRHEIIIIEGAGSPAEINLMDQDVANMKVARLAKAPVLLVCDVAAGGALAAAVGTMLLLPADDRERVAGFVFNKFRGDRRLLAPGLDLLVSRTGRPVLGVVPYLPALALAAEDGVALDGAVYMRPEEGQLQIRVVRLPHISNFTDLDALGAEPDVAVSFVQNKGDLAGADAVILPGTKNSVSDLQFLRSSGLADELSDLAGSGMPVVGICGGYQLLGRRLLDLGGHEAGGAPGEYQGLGLLEVVTTFYNDKRVTRSAASSLLPYAVGCEVAGYEIHMGRSERLVGCRPAFVLRDGKEEGAGSLCGTIFGTYLHGVFDNDGFRRSWLNMLRLRRGRPPLAAAAVYNKENVYNRLAAEVRPALDMDSIYGLLGLPWPRRGGEKWPGC